MLCSDGMHHSSLLVQVGDRISLSFTAFALETAHDFVKVRPNPRTLLLQRTLHRLLPKPPLRDACAAQVYDGIDEYAPQLASLTGSSLPPTLVALSGSLFVLFTTDGGISASGFQANYEASRRG